MNKTIKHLTEQRAAKEERMRALTSAAREREQMRMTAEESAEFDTLHKEVEEIKAELRRQEIAEELDRNNAQQMRGEQQGSEQVRAFCTYMRALAKRAHGAQLTEEQRTALTMSNSGAVVPKEISDKVTTNLVGKYAMLGAIDFRVTEHAHTFVEPMLAGDFELERIVIGAAQKEGEVSFSGIEIKAHDYRLPVIPISITLMEGSDLDIEQAVVNLLTEHIARSLTNLATSAGATSNGADANGVTALLPNLPVVAGKETDSITYDDLVNLVAKVKSPYGDKDQASFMMSTATRASLMRVLDGNNRPIFVESVREGEPDRVLGRPIVINDKMPEIAAGAKPIVYGALKKYVLRVVKGAQIRIYAEQAYLKDNCIGVQGFITADGKLLAKSGSIEPLAALELAEE